MPYIQHNANPCYISAPDCVIRAVSAATGKTWHRVYAELCVQGYKMCNLPHVNYVWAAYLTEQGYPMRRIARACTVREFVERHSDGIYILGTGTHAVAVIGGYYIDSWDSGDETPLYYFTLEE